MNPAQLKAAELIEKYLKLDIEIGGLYDGYLTMKIHEAKQCAIIAVDEILNTLDSGDIIYGSEYRYEVSIFLQEVKKELTI